MDLKKILQAFLQYIAQKYKLKSLKELESKIQELGEKGVQKEFLEFLQVLLQQGAQLARFGAKLNYIKGLKGQCPTGYELKYFKKGGVVKSVCTKCQAAKKEDPIKSFKCSRKIKKADGGLKVVRMLSPEYEKNYVKPKDNRQKVNTDAYREGEWSTTPYGRDGSITEYIQPHFYPNAGYYPQDTEMQLERYPESRDSTITITTPEMVRTYTKGINPGFRSAANIWEKAKKKTKLPRK